MVPADILDKVINEKWGANEIALELAARAKITGYKPFSMTTAQLKTRLEEKLTARPLCNKEQRVARLEPHLLECRLQKGKCVECTEFYDLAGHDKYMDSKWRRDDQKRVADMDHNYGLCVSEIAAPFKISSIVEAVSDVGMGLTQYSILCPSGKAYITIDARGTVHSQDLRGVALIELPVLLMQIRDHHGRNPLKK